MSEPIMKFIRTAERMEEDDPPILYHDRVRTTGQTRQEMYGREEAGELRDKLSEILSSAEPAPVPGRITIPPLSLERARDGLVPVHHEHGGHFLNFSRPQLEAIVRQGLPMLSEDARREIAAEAYEDLEEQTLPEPETALEASEVEALWFAIRQCRTISDGKIRHRACDRAAAALRRLSGTSEPGVASPATGSRRSPFEAVVNLAITVKDNPDAADVLGVKADDYGLDVAEAVARWAKNYRAPEPSPDLKEALGAALRSWRASLHTVTLDGPGITLMDIIGSDAEEELDSLADHLAKAVSKTTGQPTTGEARALLAGANELDAALQDNPAAGDRLACMGLGVWPNDTATLLVQMAQWVREFKVSDAPPRPITPEDPETPHDWRLYRLEQFSVAHALQIAGLESEIAALRAELESVGRRAAEAIEGVSEQTKALDARLDVAAFRIETLSTSLRGLTSRTTKALERLEADLRGEIARLAARVP